MSASFLDNCQSLELVVGLNVKDRDALKRDVVLAVLGGRHLDAVAVEFGVSRASAYNWVKNYLEGGNKGLIRTKGDRRFALPGETPEETIRNVLAFLRHFPNFSADELSAHYADWGWSIPPRTMRSIFKMHGVGTDAQRQEKAYKPDEPDEPDEPDYSHLIDEVLDAVILEIEAEEKREPSGHNPGDVLVQDRFKFPAGACDEPLAIELIVDTFASTKRIFAKIGTPTEQLSKLAFEEVRRIYEQQSHRIHTICTPRKRQYSGDLGAFAYPDAILKSNYTVLDVRPAASRDKDSRIKAAWSILRTQWLKTLPTRLALKDMNPKQIEDDLQDWLLAHRK
jgi:transposase